MSEKIKNFVDVFPKTSLTYIIIVAFVLVGLISFSVNLVFPPEYLSKLYDFALMVLSYHFGRHNSSNSQVEENHNKEKDNKNLHKQ